VNTWIGRAAFAAIVVLGAATADAQITTVMDPPKRVDPKAQVAAKREEVAQDSIARVTMTGMKQWVDSAATALAVRPDTGAISVSDTAVTSPQQPAKRTASATNTPTRPAAPAEFRDGARAPNTGTPLPTIVLIGAVMVLVGVVMRRRPSTVEARTARR
jgi:cobalamin biosynthesis Mg chelatase CobN